MSTEPHTTESHAIVISGITVQVIRKESEPATSASIHRRPGAGGRAPAIERRSAIRLALISRLGWIRKQQAKFEGGQERTVHAGVRWRRGHFYRAAHLLNVVSRDGPPTVILRNKTTMDLFVRTGSDLPGQGTRAARLVSQATQADGSSPGGQVGNRDGRAGLGVGRERDEERTHSGSCNPQVRRIWMNLELIKKPADCLEYVVVQ